jgi:glycosyltransferase involved in cell wall biosynthesis
MPAPRASVVVPAYNSARTIDRALGSVLAQTVAGWEVIVADDGSADGTAARVAAFDDPRIALVRAPSNRGPAAARNLALERATGDAIAFLDADDWWEPQFLERQLARLTDGIGIAACDARIASPDGARFERGTYYGQFRAVEPVTVERLLRRNVLFVSCVVPRAAGEEVGWFDEDLFGTEDHDLWIKLLETGRRCAVSREPLAVYRRTAASISRNTARQAANNQKTLRAALARGRLTPGQRRIARSELRYNRALEVVAGAAYDGRRPSLRELPEVGLIAATRPRHWGEWLTALRSR